MHLFCVVMKHPKPHGYSQWFLLVYSVILDSIPGKIEDDEPDEDSGAEPASTSTGTSVTSPGAIRSGIVKRRRSETLELLERYLASKDSRDREKDEQQQDEVDLFLRSLAPALRRLPASKQSLVKLQIQKILHDAEFGQPSFPQISSVSPSNQLLLQCSVVKPSWKTFLLKINVTLKEWFRAGSFVFLMLSVLVFMHKKDKYLNRFVKTKTETLDFHTDQNKFIILRWSAWTIIHPTLQNHGTGKHIYKTTLAFSFVLQAGMSMKTRSRFTLI